MKATGRIPGRMAVIKRVKRYSAVVFLFVPVILLILFLHQFRSSNLSKLHHHLEDWYQWRHQQRQKDESDYLWRYIKRVCRVQYGDRQLSTLSEEQLEANTATIGTPAGTLSWCKTFDGNVSFAGLNEWLRPFRREEQPVYGQLKPTKRFHLLLVEHPFLRLARFYRDCLQNVSTASGGPFIFLALEIRAKSTYLDLMNPPSFSHFLRFATDDANRWSAYAAYWQPYTMTCEPCRSGQFTGYDAVVKLEPSRMGTLRRVLFGEAGGNVSIGDSDWQKEVEQLRTLYQSVDEELMERLVDYYQDDLTVLAYSAEQFFREVYRSFSSEIIQVRPF
ncbi:uncharacterized protein LOC131676469 isoform X1 [Topomyia yanbarensis]|uniref:uncharacterized protein LOC131676469 isoform X1 n=1 Tax=Topomyia yanbarensis TaxID=2498891 RepID=UPI00273B827F|nr:uncharacterized protein LOC131676469 isoform X1 [Topomyia yanbarensis]